MTDTPGAFIKQGGAKTISILYYRLMTNTRGYFYGRKRNRKICGGGVFPDEEKLKHQLFESRCIADEAQVDLEKAQMALEELLDQYDWSFEPNPQKAVAYMNSLPGSDARKDTQAECSWLYMCGYKKIMWLVHVALDYVDRASESVTAVAEGKAVTA